MYIFSWIDDSIESQLDIPGSFILLWDDPIKRFIMIPGTDKLFLKDDATRSVIVSFKDGILTFVPGYPIVTTNQGLYSTDLLMMPGLETLIFSVSRNTYTRISVYEFCSLSCSSCPSSNVEGICTSCNPNFEP